MSNKSSLLPIAMGIFSLLAIHSAGAQAPTTLSLSAPVSTASAGQSVTFTVLLTGGSNTIGYDFYVNLNPTFLSFAPSAFTFNANDGFASTSPTAFSTISGGQMEVSSAVPVGTSVGSQAGTMLGTFTVSVNSVPATATVTQITFGNIGLGDGQSNVLIMGGANELSAITPASLTLSPAAAPEPSQTAGLGLGILGLAGLVLRARKAGRKQESN